VLGPEEGFALLVALLRQPDNARYSEQRVVVAEAVAEAWTRLSGADGPQQTVLAGYDPAELATLCAAVDPHPLTWHVAAVINAWPTHAAVQDFAEQLITDIRPLGFGIPDTIPVIILRAYCARDDARSQQLCEKVFSQFGHIDPELREVLVFELARSSLAVGDLVDVLADWEKEPDSEVRRTAFVGLVQVIKRDQQVHDQTAGAGVLSDQMQWLLQKINDNLCAYGPDLDDLRQLAWIGMLMLGDVTLSDGITEWIGQPRAVGVKLTKLPDGAVDQILVDLVAENWDRLRDHFGDDVYQRLDRSSDDGGNVADHRHAVMSALATTATRFPAIAEMLRQEADTDPKLRQEPYFLLWAKHENRGDEAVLRALVAKLGATMQSWGNQVLEAVLDRESWSVSDDTLKAVLTDDARTTRSGANSACHGHSPPTWNYSRTTSCRSAPSATSKTGPAKTARDVCRASGTTRWRSRWLWRRGRTYLPSSSASTSVFARLGSRTFFLHSSTRWCGVCAGIRPQSTCSKMPSTIRLRSKKEPRC